jgi:hypothetical protein
LSGKIGFRVPLDGATRRYCPELRIGSRGKPFNIDCVDRVSGEISQQIGNAVASRRIERAQFSELNDWFTYSQSVVITVQFVSSDKKSDFSEFRSEKNLDPAKIRNQTFSHGGKFARDTQ